MVYHQLTKLEQLNVQADVLAQSKARSILQHNMNHQSISLPFNQCKITITTPSLGFKSICSMLIQSLRQFITKNDLREYWIKMKNLNNLSYQIDWRLRAKSLTNIPQNQQQWLCKHSTGFCGVGSMLQRYKYQSHTRCPRCLQDGETPSHVFTCRGEGIQSLWEGELTKLSTWMQTQPIPLETTETIVNSLLHYRDPLIHIKPPSNSSLQRALQEQHQIGWNSFIEGFWSNSFLLTISHHFTNNNIH